MIKFRQKEYSSLTTKAIYQGKKALNAVRKTAKQKSTMNLKRASIKSAKGIKHSKNELLLNPGNVIGERVVRPTIEAPITGVASKVIPVPGMTATQVTVLAPMEKKLYPKVVREGLERVGKYVGKKSAHAINATKEILQHNPGTFFPGM